MIVTVAGWLFLSIASVGVLLIGLSMLGDATERWDARRKAMSLASAKAAVGRRMHDASFWFSENRAAYEALRIYADGLLHDMVDESELRQQWREALKGIGDDEWMRRR